MENQVVVTQQSGVIKCDFEGAKAYLQRKLDEYKGIIFTEDTKQDAKKTVADLRKEKKAFADRVKEVKAEYMKPFDDFFMQASVLIDLFDEPINHINSQIEEFEAKRVEEKKKLIDQLYLECIGDMCDILPLKKIYNPKWENATVNPTNIRKEMVDKLIEVKKGIEAIKDMKSEVEEFALKMYLDTFDLTSAILYINQHEKQKAEIIAREQERIRREEEERIRREERAKIEAERKAEEEKKIAVQEAKEEAKQEAIDGFIPTFEGVSTLYEYRISLTEDAKAKLEMFMDSVGIEWEMI